MDTDFSRSSATANAERQFTEMHSEPYPALAADRDRGKRHVMINMHHCASLVPFACKAEIACASVF